MKMMFFPRLAVLGIKRNKKIYVPYILGCIGMVAMSYIITSLSLSPVLKTVESGNNLMLTLSLGKFVIAAFALFFLMYANSFLIKKRYRELGLYNVLGMDKAEIAKIVLCESLDIALLGITGGIVTGAVFSKIVELGLLNVIRQKVNYTFTFSFKAAAITAVIFGIIFLLITVKSLIEVATLKPLELIKSENFGEKPPKANPFLAMLGIVILAAAYYIAVTIKSPLSALLIFFVAVIMVIIATYMLFVSGSVFLCKVLKSNRRYYYKKRHFVSVSSMSYRMKRNGVGLASVCILSTMVLVMLSSTASLYFGAEDSLKTRFSRSNEIVATYNDVSELDGKKTEKLKKSFEKTFDVLNVKPKNTFYYGIASVSGLLKKDIINTTVGYNSDLINYDDVRTVYFVLLDDYNRIENKKEELNGNEILIYPMHCNYGFDRIRIDDTEFKISKKLDSVFEIGVANSLISPSFTVVIKDYGVIGRLAEKETENHEKILSCSYYYGYDCIDESLNYADVRSKLVENASNDSALTFERIIATGYDAEKNDFFATYGSFFFLGIVLSIVFIFAAVMIIYYKQISEGYEDKQRFRIMMNVGMTKQDIKKSINSQILTVFFAPLLFAGVHLAFAFPLIWKILMLFSLNNIAYVIGITVAAFVCFSLFYAAVYKLTAKAYYSIVTENDKA